MLYRCSLSAFYNAVKEFSNEQKYAIYRIGLSPLLQIHENIHLRRHIIDFVVEHCSLKSGAVMVDDTTIPISLTDMHNDPTEILSKALEQLSDLQRIVGEHSGWRVEVEKDFARRKLHDNQMTYVIEDLSQKIATQDTIIDALQEQLSKKETSTQHDSNKRFGDIDACKDEIAVSLLLSLLNRDFKGKWNLDTILRGSDTLSATPTSPKTPETDQGGS
ncbi:hypothetical protein HHK36_012115 [Tetracentron sinense]|uniref:Uncharacterized protein n=1 Tax=Tetracentron sinense TaxID=13715 RepID=A0A834Z464_TETSI|nr:hypothetical protein HHK36_012115 [Tetracentron sinense]